MCFLNPKNISSWCGQLMLLFRTHVAIRRRSKFKLCAADGTAGKNGCVPHSFVANCYIRIPSRSSIMLYVSPPPPPCPFQSALSGWSGVLGWVLHLLYRLHSNLIGIVFPSSLPLHHGSLRLQGPNAFVDETEIQFHNGQMIYSYLC